MKETTRRNGEERQTPLVRPPLRFDEWKEPSEEALSGGRGMFCILPLTKALLQKSSESINFVASSMLKVMETPELISPKVVQSTVTHHVHNIASSIEKIEFSLREASTRRREEN
ncbi:uncharacterized protein [Primulina eburnea]|uniref:uncharacterized protein isoform X1 n=1 Tax=Primulina eburnea TaxID=1245227 RepID=UPI003C6BE66B